MSRIDHCRTSVSSLMGATVLDGAGRHFGTVREFAVRPQADASRVFALVLRLAGSARGSAPALLPVTALTRESSGVLRLADPSAVQQMPATDEYLLLERDLLDQQIIDVHGHKVVRVNDVDLFWESCPSDRAVDQAEPRPEQLSLRIAEVEVGVRGAIRRMLKGLPHTAVDRLATRVRPSVIPWDFVDLIDRDPSRRVRLKIEQDRLSKMHPSDLADILEELAPAEGQALFQSLDEEVAAEALEEVELKTQKKLIELLDSERVAGIIEEMDPASAADLLSELPEERSDAILEEMGEKERHDVEELLEYDPDSAAGLMTTEFLTIPETATVAQAIQALRDFDGDPETITDLFVLDAEAHLHGVLALSRVLLTEGSVPVADLHEARMVTSGLDANGRKVAELFDKYNLRCLPILDEDQRVAGVIHAEHVIAWLRTK